MSAKLEEMLRIAQEGSLGEFLGAFNSRTAEALVKVALAAQAFDGVVKPTWQCYGNMREALSALTAAMASEDGRSPTEGLSEAKPSEEDNSNGE